MQPLIFAGWDHKVMSWVVLSSDKLHTFLYFSNLSACKSLQMPDISRCFFFYKCQSMKSLMHYIWKNSSTFPTENCDTLESSICVFNHSQRSKVLLKALVSARGDAFHSRCIFSTHLTHSQSSRHATKRDAPSYHPSKRAFYGPSKDNELPEWKECLQHEVTANTPDTD